MLVVALGLSLGWPSVGPQMVRPGMPFRVAGALIPEKPIVLNRTDNQIRAVEYPRAKIALTLDDQGRILLVNGKGDEPSAEKELERITKSLPMGFKRVGLPTLLKAEERPDKADAETYGYARVRLTRMTSDTTAKITVGLYMKHGEEEEECEIIFVHLSWYRDCWTVSKYEGSIRAPKRLELLAGYIDDVSGGKP